MHHHRTVMLSAAGPDLALLPDDIPRPQGNVERMDGGRAWHKG